MTFIFSQFSDISKLEPYCLNQRIQMLALKIHQSQKKNLRRTLRKELAIKISADVAIAEGLRHTKKVSAVRIKKKFWKNTLKAMAPYRTKPSKQRWLKEHIGRLHYDCNNASATLLQHHNVVAMSEAVTDLSLEIGDKTGILKRNTSFLKFRQRAEKISVKELIFSEAKDLSLW